MVVAVADLTRTNRCPPTLAEIAEVLGWASPSTPHGYVQRLVDAGVLHVEPRQGVRLARGIVTTRRGLVCRTVWPEPAEIVLDPTGCPFCRDGDAS